MSPRSYQSRWQSLANCSVTLTEALKNTSTPLRSQEATEDDTATGGVPAAKALLTIDEQRALRAFGNDLKAQKAAATLFVVKRPRKQCAFFPT